MKRVRPRTGGHAHDSTAVAPKFSRVIAGENAKFRDGIGIGVVDHQVVQQVIVQVPVQKVGDRVATVASDIEKATVVIGIGWSDSGLKQRKLQHVAAVQRRIADHLADDYLPQRRADGLDLLGLSIDVNLNPLSAYL